MITLTVEENEDGLTLATQSIHKIYKDSRKGYGGMRKVETFRRWQRIHLLRDDGYYVRRLRRDTENYPLYDPAPETRPN